MIAGMGVRLKEGGFAAKTQRSDAKDFLPQRTQRNAENLFWILESGFWIYFLRGGLAVDWLLHVYKKSLQAEIIHSLAQIAQILFLNLRKAVDQSFRSFY
jgi:hypothetical protein